MIISELWSDKDEAACVALKAAIAASDLVGALLAVEGASEARAQQSRAALERWGDRVSVRARFGTAQARLDQLRYVLVDELGFEGDADDYHGPRNSLISHVIERRRGMPILISCVWMAVGRLASIQVDGIALPGHYIVRVGGTGGSLVDAFNRGTVLSVDDCKKLVGDGVGAELQWSDAWLEPAALAATIERVLRNLAHAYARRGDAERLYRTSRKLGEIRPDLADVQLDVARASEKLGAAATAEEVYVRIVTEFAGSREARLASERLTRVRPASRLPN